MKLAKKTLSVFLSFLMIFGACSVCLSGFTFSAAAISAADTQTAVNAATSKVSAFSSSSNTSTFNNDDGKMLAAAEAVYSYATGIRGSGTEGGNNSSDTLTNAVKSNLGMSSGNAATLITRVLYPSGTTVYGYSNRQTSSGSYEDSTNNNNTNGNGNVTYNGNVTNNVTKKSVVNVDINAYLQTFGTIASIPSSFPTKITYTFTHSYSTNVKENSRQTIDNGCDDDTYRHNWTSEKWNYLTGVSRTVNSSNTTAKNILQTAANYFTTARLNTTSADLLGNSAADLQALYNTATAEYNKLNVFSSATVSKFFDTDKIEAYLSAVEFAMQVVLAQPNMQTMLGYINGGYDENNLTEMTTLYTNASAVYNSIKSYDQTVFDFILANYEGFTGFTLASSKAFLDDLTFDINVYNLRQLKISIDNDIAANEAKLTDLENKDDITDLELAALKDKANGWKNTLATYTAAEIAEVFTDGTAYVSTFAANVQAKIDARGAQVQYENYYTYFIPYIFANISKWTNEEIETRYNEDVVKKNSLVSSYNSYVSKLPANVLASIFTFTYEESDYLLTTAAIDYIARLKQNIIDRNNAQLEAIKAYSDMSTTVNFTNFIGIKTAVENMDQDLYDYTAGKGWVDSSHLAIYNSISGLINAYNAFIAGDGLDSFVQTHYHDANGVYTTRYAGEQVVNGNTVGYANDIARDGADDNYDVTETKINDTITKLDKFITSKDFCSLAQLKNSETGETYDDLSQAIEGILKENLFTNEMVNTLVGALFPMICSTIADLLGNIGNMNLDGISPPKDPNAICNIDLGILSGDQVTGTLDIYIDGQHNTQLLINVFEGLGINIYPSSLSKVLPSKYSAIKSTLTAAGNDWTKIVGADGETKLDFDWGVTDYDSFVSAVSSVFDSILPLIQTAFSDSNYSRSVNNIAFGTGPIKYSVLSTTASARVGATISVDGMKMYKTLWIPVMEALGVTNDGYRFANIPTNASSYQLVSALFDPVLHLIDVVKVAPISTVCEILPQLLYFLSMDGLQSLIGGFNIPLHVKINQVSGSDLSFSGGVSWLLNLVPGLVADILNKQLPPIDPEINLGDTLNLKEMLGFEYTNINALLEFLFEKLELDLSLPTINAGEIILCSSYNRNTPTQRLEGTRLSFTADKADVFYFLLNYLVNAVGNKDFVDNIVSFIVEMNKDPDEPEDPDAEPFELPEIVYTIVDRVNGNPDAALAALVELFNPVKYDTEEYDWYKSDYNYGSIAGLNDASIVYLNYGNNWTKEKSEYVVNNVDSLLESILEMTGSEETSVNAMLQKAVASMFNNTNVTALIKGLVTLGVAIDNDFVYDLIEREFGVDLTIWADTFGYLFPDVFAEYEKAPVEPTDPAYVNAIPTITAGDVSIVTSEITGEEVMSVQWIIKGTEFTDGDRAAFVDLFCDLCGEFAPIIAMLFNGDDIGLFNNAITILGYDSYSSSVGAIFEMLGVENVMTQAQYSAYVAANGDAEAFNYLTDQLFNWLDDVLSGNTIAKILDILPQLVYFIESNGLSTSVHNCIMPILVVLDDVRPIIDINLDSIVSSIISDLINGESFDIANILDLIMGTAEDSTNTDYVKYDISLSSLTFENIIPLVDQYFGTDLMGAEFMKYGIKGLCAGAYENTTSVLPGSWTTNMDTADALTITISALLETFRAPAKDTTKTNGQIICEFVDSLIGEGDGTQAQDIWDGIQSIFEDVETDLDDIHWAYMYGDTFDYTNLASLTLPEHSIVYLGYSNNWNEASAEYLDGVLADLIDQILDSTGNSDLATVLTAAINDGLYTNDILNTIIEAIVKLLVSLDDTLRGLVDAVLDTDIQAWFDYCNITTDSEGNVEVECTKNWGVTDKASFISALKTALAPAESLISWLFFGTDYRFFTGTQQNPDGSYKYNDIITIAGGEGYAYGLVPILEALGCTMGYAGTDSGIKPQSAYLTGSGTYDVSTAIDDVLNSVFGLLDDVGDAPIDVILAKLPNIVYFINADGVKVSVNNLLAPVYGLLEKLSGLVGEVNLDETLGFPLSDITWDTVFDILDTSLSIKVPVDCQNLIKTFYMGEVTYFTSANGRGAFNMGYTDEQSRKDMLTIVLSLAVDVIGAPENEEQFTTLFGSNVYGSIKNILNMKDAKPMQDFSWYYTEFANTDKTFSAIDTSGKYVSTYNKYWTKDKAQYVSDNLQAFIDNMLCLLGLEVNGMDFDSINDIVKELIDGNLYTQATATKLVNVIKDATSKITGLNGYGEYIASVLKTSTGLDLHAWDNMSVTVTDGDRASFTAALCDILRPAMPLLKILLADEDVSFFINIDGEDMITIPGSEGYAYGLVPVLEALKCDNITTPDAFKALIDSDPDAAVKAVVNPVFDKIDAIEADPIKEVVAILPGVIYFINSNGLDTCVKNILNSADTVIEALEPALGETNCEKLFGIDEISTYNFDYILNLALDAVKNSTGYDLTPFAADAISELTVGKVVSYQSLNGNTYYTMEYASEMDKADMITILLRIAIDFITMDENVEKIEALLKDYIPNEDNYAYVCSMINSLATAASEDPGMGQALHVLYYIFYGLNNAAEVTDDWYHDVNNSWQFILKLLDDSNEPMLNGFSSEVKDFLNTYFEGIFDDGGVASNGFITFFQKLIAFFQKIAAFFKGLFS